MLKLAINAFRWIRYSAFKLVPYITMRRLTFDSEAGIGAFFVVIAAALLLLGGIVVATPEIRTQLLPQTSPSMPASNIPTSPIPSPTPSEKQKLYIKNKDLIQEKLNLNDEQFDILVENAEND